MAVKVNSSGNTVNTIKVRSGNVVRNVTIGRVNVGGVTRIFFPDGDLENLTRPLITNPNDPNAAITSDNRIGPSSATTLSVSNGAWTVNNVLVTPTSFVYAWKRNGISVGGNFNTYTPNILDRGGIITCTVTATYQGKTAAADSSNSILVASLPGTPNAPTLTRGTRQLTVNWNSVASGGLPLDYYVVRHRQSGTSSWTSVFINSGTTAFNNREYIISSLSDNTSYEVQVAAANTEGQGNFSNTSTASTFGVPINTVAPTISPTSFTANQTTLTANRGSWSSDLIINTYRYIWAYSSTSSFTSSTIFADQTRDPSQSSTVTTPNLPGFFIRLTVVATNAVGDSSPANSIVYGPIATPIPETPTNFTKSTGGCGFSFFTWTASEYATFYTIQYSTNSGFTNIVGSTNIASTASGTITGRAPSNVQTLLTRGTYYFRILAGNSSGSSSYSAGISGFIDGVPNIPGAPSTSAACNAITVSWSAVTGATYYTVYRYLSNGSSLGSININSGTTYTHTGLNPANSYYYTVAAGNDCGISSESSASGFRSPAGIPTTTGSRPNLSGSFKSGTAISSSTGGWDSNNSAITSYNYTWQFRFNKSSSFSDLSTSTSNNRTIPSSLGGAESGGQFLRSRVTAVNGCGESADIYTSQTTNDPSDAPSDGIRIRCGDIGFASRGTGSTTGCASGQRRYPFSWGASSGASFYYYEIRRTVNDTLVESGVVSGTSVTSGCFSTSTTIAWKFRVVGIPFSTYSASTTANGDFREITGTGW